MNHAVSEPKLTIPELALVVLIGPSGSGKSTFAQKHFKATEVLSSDFCRGLVSDDENDQSASKDAFAVLHYIAGKRLASGRLTVIDATNVQVEGRAQLVALAREHHCIPVAIVFDVPESLCHARNATRSDRSFGPHVVRQQRQQLRRSIRGLGREGFRHIHVLSTPEQIDSVFFERQPLWSNRKTETGPFDVIGDVHGCFDELVLLLNTLGYAVKESEYGYDVTPPGGRKAVYVGDLVDRGPKVAAVLRLVMAMVEQGVALCVPGNHDIKLVKKLRGKNVNVSHGLAESIAQLEQESPEFRTKAAAFLDGLTSHFVLDGGRLVVAHAGMKESMQGRGSGRVRDFALYGETTGETDEFGLPVRYPWAEDYRGRAIVVYGHTPVPEPEWVNNTINIDTGCVFGGALTALRYPEKEIVSVPAIQKYCEPTRPIARQDERPRDLLDVKDVLGKRIITTRYARTVTVREENAIAALELMGRFAVDPKWLIYLPPTMSPSETSAREDLLEHPDEAFAYFRREGIERVICQEKHMGSRAVVVLCRDEAAARRRFRVHDGTTAVCYTRTGRQFFNDATLERGFFESMLETLTRADFWSRLDTDWVCLDCELMPWSAKARELLRTQYAAVGTAAQMGLGAAERAIAKALERGVPLQNETGTTAQALLASVRNRGSQVEQYRAAYRRYCWPVSGVGDYKLAPFHVLATDGAVHADKPHTWHMDTIASLCDVQNQSGLLTKTECQEVDLADESSCAEGAAWWTELTAGGGEGMVVKPLEFVRSTKRGLVQPALKCRGREYLRIIYGPEYTEPTRLARLRSRATGRKRSLAVREFSLGLEGLHRFVEGEPLHRVHECVFGVLALESEPVDPRL
jgi:protein phosphatase